MTDGLTAYRMRHADREPAPTGQRYPLDAYPPDDTVVAAGHPFPPGSLHPPAGPAPYREATRRAEGFAHPQGNGSQGGRAPESNGYGQGNVYPPYPPYPAGRSGGPSVAPPPLPPVEPEAWLQNELVPVMLPASLVELLRRRVGPEGLSFYITGVLLRHEPMAALAEFHRRARG